jgi:bile acid-coenzyme A ligase
MTHEIKAFNALIENTDDVPLSQILKYHADRDPDYPAVTMDDSTLSRRMLDEASNRLARDFIERGVKPDDLVTLALPNSVDFFVMIFAIWKCGATPHPVSWRLPLHEIQAIVDLACPALVIGGPDGLRASNRIAAGYKADSQVSVEPLPPLTATYWKAVSSGGSTGRPKIIVAHKRAAFDPNIAILGQRVGGAVLSPGPLYSNGPFINSVLGLICGSHAVIMPRFDERRTLEMIQRHKIDYMFLVPTMMSRIWRLGKDCLDQYDLSSLRTVLHSAAPCPEFL